jgi:DNA polymerase V
MALTVLGPLGSDVVVPLPLFLSRVPAGFPSPADDYVEAVVDLNEVCGVDGVSTYLVRVDHEGTSMLGANICPGDVLVVDRSLDAEDGDIVVAAVGGELTVKTVRVERDRRRRAVRVWLEPEADGYPVIEVSAEEGLEVWGVVRWIMHRAGRRPRRAVRGTSV